MNHPVSNFSYSFVFIFVFLQKREKEELERQLKEGLLEEERFKKIVAELMSGEVKLGEKHPFRKVLERLDCHCPPAVTIKPPY